MLRRGVNVFGVKINIKQKLQPGAK